jgi:hypothetical protein
VCAVASGVCRDELQRLAHIWFQIGSQAYSTPKEKQFSVIHKKWEVRTNLRQYDQGIDVPCINPLDECTGAKGAGKGGGMVGAGGEILSKK